MALCITEAEILEALRLAQVSHDVDGFTMQELRQALGLGTTRTREIIGELFRAGKLRLVGKRVVIKVDGTAGRIPAYRLT